MAFLRISICMRRLNPKTNKPFKYGDVREDGYIFVQYRTTRPIKSNGFLQEYWLKPEKFINRSSYSANKKVEWRKTNYEYSLAYGKYHRKIKAVQYTAKAAKRRAAKLLRTPKWLTADDLFMIEEAYHLAKLRTELLGVQYHVDHILPLQGKKVSGLHVPANLQVIPAKENLKKSNRHE